MPGPTDPRLREALALRSNRKFAAAASLCRQILAERPGDAETSLVLATLLREGGRAEESVGVLRAALAANPANRSIAPELGASLVVASRAAEALPMLQRLASDAPEDASRQYWLAQAYLRLWKPAEGIRHLERARELEPHNAELLFALGAALLSAGRPKAAESKLRDYLAAQPRSIPGRQALAVALDQQNRAEEAAAEHRALLEQAPNYPPALAAVARHMQTRGQTEEAIALVAPALNPQNPDPSLASVYASLCAGADRPLAARGVVEQALRTTRLPAQAESSLRFALAKIEESAGRSGEAFEQYRLANDLAPRTFNPEARRRFTEAMVEAFPAEPAAAMPRSTRDSRRPVIVCGMPRSGTTLVEQIIASHPLAFGAGELPHLRAMFSETVNSLPGRTPVALAGVDPGRLDALADRYLAALHELDPHAERVVDKMPHNAEILGFVAMVLPGAAVIHCSRDPIDTCASCYMTPLSPVHDYANRLEDLAFAYGQYARLVGHWRRVLQPPMLEVSYESLVDDVGAGARRIIEFLGLPWDDRCLKFYENARVVATASVDQVRRPIYKSSVARWKRYEAQLAPLRAALRQAGIDA
ncbi:MAG: sulfotransferase [Phycisphaerales bacterium]|nr:sulfotransferase [Phycisphaerales bacterium]